MNRIITILILGFCSLLPVWAQGDRYTANSALSEGKWMKIQVESTGIYKLTYADLKSMGFADPAKVGVYGYGGCPLEEDFTKSYTDDIPAVPVWKGPDYILFYAKGIRKWEYSGGLFTHTNNPYAIAGYYFLTDRFAPVAMQEEPSATETQQTVNTYDDYLLHETELASVNFSGRELFGESFEVTSSRSFTYNIPGIVNEPGKATLRFIARPEKANGSVVMTIGSETIANTYIRPDTGPNSSYTKAIEAVATGNWDGEKKETVQVKISYGLTQDKNARLDYFRLQMKRELRPYDASTLFRSIASIQKSTRFSIADANDNTMVFDVTDPLNPKQMQTMLNGSELTFSIPAQLNLREFALVQKDRVFLTPTVVGEVKNQNLHGLPQLDMIIIAQAAFKAQAERLAEVHRNSSEKLTVEVVDPQLIYNEFSSGTPDATAYRRFMKMFYDRSSSEGNPPRYLLLFGDGIYDNRGLYEKDFVKEYGDRLLLTYQSVNSLDIGSYVTDDYFGFLDDSEGKNIPSDGLDIGIGRLPVRTAAEAKQVVDKLIGYMDNSLTGVWKNSVCFVADDGNTADKFTTTHMWQAEQLAKAIETSTPEFLVNKVYLDAYKKDFTGGQSRYPTAQAKIQRLLKDGLLVLNYTGHGDTKSWTEERVMTESDILQASYPYLPLWITATCDFTRFDDPVTSAGERVLLNKTSGGIALFTTTRVVYSNGNFTVNQQLINHLFDKQDGVRLSLGDIMRKTKTAPILKGDSNKLNFILVGDPAMKLAYPENRMQVTAINGKSVSGDPVTFKAMEKITIEGEVLATDGKRMTDFNGIVMPTVFDSQALLKTLDNNKTGEFAYTDYPNKLYTGQAAVTDGKFTFTFEVPKDISYSDKAGKLNLYAFDEATGDEAQGSFVNYVVGGTADNVDEDTVGPEIRAIFLNDTTFVDGGKVNATPLFAARLWDKSGVNITGSSLGHDILLTIDNQPTRSYVLNSYYEPIPGTTDEGIVVFPIPELAPGIHTAEFVVWDVRNNSSKDTITFEVVEGLKPSLIELVATPNPAREQVEFRLVHNRPETMMDVTLMVYDITGRLLWMHTEKGSSELFKSYVVTWNLTDNTGSRLHPGVYFYRAAIRSNSSKEATKANKLLILAQ